MPPIRQRSAACSRLLALVLGAVLVGAGLRAERQSFGLDAINFAVEPAWSYGALITVPYTAPNETRPLRGILLWGNGAGSDERARAHDLELAELAEQLDFALVATSTWKNFSEDYEIEAFDRLMDYLGDATDQPWLSHAPILPLGMSNGGQMSYGINALWPARTIAFAANKGGFYNNPLPAPAALETPGLLITGGADAAYRHDGILALFDNNRPRGARWAWAEEEGVGHTIADSMELILPFATEMARLRYPASTLLPVAAPASLATLPESSGWLVARDEHLDGLARVVPYSAFTSDPATASWLPTRRTAFIYRAFASHDKASPSAVLTPDWPTVQRGTTLTYTIAPTDPTWTRIDTFEGDTLLRSATPADVDPLSVQLTPEVPGYVVLHALVTYADGRQRTTMPRRKLVSRGHRYEEPPDRSLWGDRDLDVGSPLHLTATMIGLSGDPPPQLVWLRNGNVLPDQSITSLSRPAVTAADAGIYQLISNPQEQHHHISAPLHVYVSDPVTPAPATIHGPASASLGGTLTLTATVPDDQPGLSYQWSVAGWDIPGATSPTLEIPLVQSRHDGDFTVTTRIRSSTTTSAPHHVDLSAPHLTGGRLLNLSVRGFHRGGAEAMIVGFVTTGGDKTVLARAVGPGLARLDLPGTLADPILTLQQPQPPPATALTLAANDNWTDSASPAALTAAAARVGAFALHDTDTDASLLFTLPAGAYSATTRGADDGTGLVLLELYDADDTDRGGRLVNLSNRGYVDSGLAMLIAGFVVAEDGPVDLLIRAVGPGLLPHGVTGVLGLPQLSLHHHVPGDPGPPRVLLETAGWRDAPDTDAIRTAAATVGAFPLPEAGYDTAALVRLQPGVYSVVVRGQVNTRGIALLELYQLP